MEKKDWNIRLLIYQDDGRNIYENAIITAVEVIKLDETMILIDGLVQMTFETATVEAVWC
jgi:hypothetical protein